MNTFQADVDGRGAVSFFSNITISPILETYLQLYFGGDRITPAPGFKKSSLTEEPSRLLGPGIDELGEF